MVHDTHRRRRLTYLYNVKIICSCVHVCVCVNWLLSGGQRICRGFLVDSRQARCWSLINLVQFSSSRRSTISWLHRMNTTSSTLQSAGASWEKSTPFQRDSSTLQLCSTVPVALTRYCCLSVWWGYQCNTYYTHNRSELVLLLAVYVYLSEASLIFQIWLDCIHLSWTHALWCVC